MSATYPPDVFPRVIWGEARGEGDIGMRAVAAVIVNRCRVAAAFLAAHGRPHPLFGDGTPESCVTAPWQFSCLNAGDPNREKLFAVTAEDPQFAVACEIVATFMAPMTIDSEDPTEGALYYKTTALPWPCSWGPEVPPVAVIGGQSFYDLGRE